MRKTAIFPYCITTMITTIYAEVHWKQVADAFDGLFHQTGRLPAGRKAAVIRLPGPSRAVAGESKRFA